MFSVFRTISLRNLGHRWFRSILIVASIALGVGTLVATRSLNDTMTRAGNAVINPMAGFADLIVSNNDLPLPRALIGEMTVVPGVRRVRPLLMDKTVLPDQGRKQAAVLGLPLFEEREEDNPLRSQVTLLPGVREIIAGEAWCRILGQTPAIFGKELADSLGGGEFTLKLQNPARPTEKNGKPRYHFVVSVGAVEGKGDAAILGGFTLIMDLVSAAKVLDFPKDHVNRFDIVLEPGANRSAVKAELGRVLGSRALVRTPEEQNESLQSVMSGMQAGFSLCGLAALVVGMFLVYNSLSVTVAERRHEIGILLALGGTKLQVLRLFAQEAALLGLIGSLLGIPLGYGLAWLALGPVQETLSEIFQAVDARGVDFSWPLVGAALAGGLVTSVVAALVPSFQAAREKPAEAVRRVPKAPSARHLLLTAATSLTMILLGGVLILARDHLPHYRIGTYGGMSLVLIGSLVASPFLAGIAARLLQPVVRTFLGIEWRLAADNLVRAPGRTGLVIGALAAGVALVIQTLGVIRSNREALRDWVDRSIAADLIVTSGSPVSASGQSLPMDPALAADFRKLPQVQEVLPVRFRKVPFGKTMVLLFAVEAAKAHGIEAERLGGAALSSPYPKILERPGNVVVSNNFAAMHALDVGDAFEVPSLDGPQKLTIVGKVEDYSWNHGSVFLDRADYLRLYGDEKVDVFDVYLQPGADVHETKRVLLARHGAPLGLHALTRSELQRRIDGMIEQLYGIAASQQLVVMLVAALGVVTALLISVLQRRREMGMLRAIGASRLQVIHSVLAEACLMGLIGTLIGLVVGIPLQWYVLNVVILEESGYLFPMLIPWGWSLIIAALAMVLATLAGLGPALVAVRQRIPEAIAYE